MKVVCVSYIKQYSCNRFICKESSYPKFPYMESSWLKFSSKEPNCPKSPTRNPIANPLITYSGTDKEGSEDNVGIIFIISS